MVFRVVYSRHTMKKKRVFFLSILIVGLITLTLIEEHNWFSDENKVEFKQAGSFIFGGNKAFVFYVTDTIWSEIEKHGLSLEYEPGNMIASFYYLENSNAPDLSLARNYMDAVDKGQTTECVAAFWKNGEPLLIKFPARSWPAKYKIKEN